MNYDKKIYSRKGTIVMVKKTNFLIDFLWVSVFLLLSFLPFYSQRKLANRIYTNVS